MDHFFDNSVTAADFNDDGKKDLAATGHGCCGGGAVSVALGNGDGTFQPTQRFVVGSGQTIPTSVASAHLNRDEEMDLVVSNSASDNVSVLTGNGDGTFQSARNFSAGDNPAFVIGADFNTDSFTDLAVPNQNSSNVSVLLNTGPAPQTTITSGPSEGQVVNNTSATFGFTSSELGSAFKCSLDNPSDSAYSPCTSPKKIPDEGLLTEGSHTFYVKATGTAGTDLTPATRTWKVDTTAPAAPVINSPANDSFDTDGNVTLAGTAEEGSTVEVFDGETSEGTTPPVDSSGAWSMTLSTVGEGAHTYTAKATDAANNTSGFSNPTKVTVDITKPTVTATTPLSRAINVTRGTNLTATFSEQMMTSSINVKSFRLFRLNADGTQTQITDVVVSLSTDGLKAKLDPFGTKTTLLARSTKYKGVVTIGTKDLAGNPLAQQKSWTFTTKS